MPRILGVAAIALAVGTGFGYWLRGPVPDAAVAPPQSATTQVDATPAPEVTPTPVATKMPEEPVGTEVAVKPAPTTGALENQGALRTPPPSPAAPTAAAAEPSATRGRLLVRSVPGGGSVTINGRGSGTTPATIRDLPFGTYTVAVSRSGYQRREQRVTISRTIPAREITLELTATTAAAPAARGATTGAVLVVTLPAGATVSIDGRTMGTAPVRVPELSPGSHEIRVSLTGRKPVTTTAVVRAGQVTTVRLSLEIQ